MTRWRDPLDVAAAIVGPRDPTRIGTSTLELVLALTRGKRGALFTCETETRLGLVVSRSLDQSVVDVMTGLWSTHRRDLFAEAGYYSPGPESFLVLGCASGETPLCLLYAETLQPSFRLAPDDLSTFRGILNRAFADPIPSRARSEEVQAYLVHTSAEDIERDRLMLLLGRHEWNISRVARLLGTTRDTVYRRLRLC